ncbi:hypothetical protein [Fodinicola feengrottensis]|uniref:hypothetical protein n=1 Tax=Fodinicola feengrottensis TaxID=435914 RepID=UPI002441A89C|nr:hypothetical protein [Fodinicola feengrottensis]
MPYRAAAFATCFRAASRFMPLMMTHRTPAVTRLFQRHSHHYVVHAAFSWNFRAAA